jgi:hypothetical protein
MINRCWNDHPQQAAAVACFAIVALMLLQTPQVEDEEVYEFALANKVLDLLLGLALLGLERLSR